jgi:hypothetical protein
MRSSVDPEVRICFHVTGFGDLVARASTEPAAIQCSTPSYPDFISENYSQKKTAKCPETALSHFNSLGKS